ncbi:YadA-like family protein, partial [Bartonella ancashensis]
QIHSINKSVENYFGGGAVIGVNGGANTAPTFTIQGSDYHNVAAAFSGVDLSLTQIKNDVSKVGENALVWSEKDGAFVALHREGDENKKSKLKFLLDGSITDQSTEAITGNQLYSLNKQLASYFGGGAEFNNERWTNPVFNVIQFLADGSLSSRKSYNNVGDAFNGMNETIAGLNNRINDLEQGHGGNNNSLNWNEKEGAYDASHGGKPSSIVNVADGKVEEGSKDAVNGGQLWDVKNDLENKINDLENSIDGANNGAAVVYDKDENGKKTNSITLQGGDEGKPVLIDNVADGKIEEGSKQAINGGQLYEYTKEQTEIVLEESKKYTDMRFDTLSYAVEDAKKEARQSAAIGLAVANLRYDDTPGALSIAFGSGLWRSQSAFAFGAGYTSEDGKIRSNFSMTNTGRHWGIGAGLSVTLN